MAFPVHPFNAPSPVVLPAKQKTNPWSSVLPSLTQAIVLGLVQNKLQGNLQKQQLKEQMLAKGYVWDEEKQTWMPPSVQTQDIGESGDKIVTQGGLYQGLYENPQFRSRLRREERTHDVGTGLDADLARMGKQDEYNRNRMIQEYRERLNEHMTSVGAKWNPEKGEYEFPYSVKKDPDSGAYLLQRGPTVTPLTEKATGAGDVAWTVTDEKGNVKPREFTTESGDKGIFTSGKSAQIGGSKNAKDPRKWTVKDAKDELTKLLERLNIYDEPRVLRTELTFTKALSQPDATPLSAFTAAANEIYAGFGGGDTGEASQLKTELRQKYPRGSKYKGRTISNVGIEPGTGRTMFQFTDGTTGYAD